MQKPLLFGAILALLGGWSFGVAEEGNPPGGTAYLFVYYTRNGEDGLHLAWSADGYKWEALGRGQSYLAPTVGKEKLMRDPCAVRGRDGVFQLVWATGLNGNDIGHASTRDFLHWSPEQDIPVMAAEPAVENTSSPGVFYDAKWQRCLIFWASAIKGQFADTERAAGKDFNSRIFCATTKDFAYFTPMRLFYDPGFPVLDATLLQAEGRFCLIAKDETARPFRKNLRIALSDSLDGPYEVAEEAFSPKRLAAGAPTAVRIGEEYLVYFEAYEDKHYGAMSSRDLKTWRDVTGKMVFPDEESPGRVERMHHATVLAVPAALVEQLRAAPLPSAPAPASPPAAPAPAPAR